MERKVLKKVFIVVVASVVLSVAIADFQMCDAIAAPRISEQEATLIVGQKLKLTVKGTKKKVKWSSTKKKVAKVSAKGKVKALKAGSTIIKAKIGKKVLKCKIKVEAPVISKNQEWLAVGKSSNIYITGNTQDVQWISDNDSIVTVEEGRITAKGRGWTYVKAMIGKKKYSCKVYVSDESMSETIEYIKEVAKLVNKERTNYGLSELELDYNLSLAAIERCKELVVEFSHTRPNGESCYSILKDYGFKMFSSRGENIASGYTTPEKVMTAWMNSEGHRDRMLDPDYEKMGVGFYFDEKEEDCYWSQFFYEL